MKTAQQAAANWTASAGRATTAYTEGVNNYSGDWAGSTTRQQAAMTTNWNQSVSSGRWASGVTNKGTAGWKSDTQAKSSSYGLGFQAGSGAFTTAIGKVMGALANGVQGLPPRGDINQNLQRANALALYMHGLKGQLGA